MAYDNDDVERLLVSCEECGSAYVAREWPDGEIRLIGKDDCECGSTDFVPVGDFEDSSPS